MKIRIVYLVLGSVIGFTVGVQTYSNVFDPLNFWQEAKILGAETARLGCVRAGSKT